MAQTADRQEREDQGEKLSSDPLPEGISLQDGRYVVVEARAITKQMNVYLVEDTSSRLCPACRTEISHPQQDFCSFCGADLSYAQPVHLRYLMQECTDEQVFAAEAQLLAMKLEHPSLLLPRAIFAEAHQGSLRHYRVKPELSLPLASSLTVPQELNWVLEWGITLAQALDYVHQHHVTPGQVSLDHIAIGGKRAYWIDLSSAHAIPAAAQATTGDFRQDVQALARALLYLATGQQEAADAQLPEQVATAFSQVLTSPAELTAASFVAALESALEGVRRPASVNLVVGRRTDVGLERALNEDSLLTLDMAPVFRSVNSPVGLFAVADGMGGHEAGDVASRLTIQAIAQEFIRNVLPSAIAGEPLPGIHQWVTDTVLVANRSIYDQCQAADTDMGTTLVMTLFVGDLATTANVGDSRAYLLNQDRIVQITTDHSLVERLVATGQITPGEAANHPQKNIIYRVIGDKPQVETDLYEQRLAPGEALLLCSDGLSGMVPDKKIWHIWRTSISPQEACDRLVKAANQAGGEDNITVVIVQVEDSSTAMQREDITHDTHEFRTPLA